MESVNDWKLDNVARVGGLLKGPKTLPVPYS